MERFTCSVPTLFGIEGITAKELRRMGMENVRAENGRVLFDGDFTGIIRANLRLRTGERVLLRLASFPAESFEALFQGVAETPLERFIPRDGSFPVKGHCLDSTLRSVPDCQRIIKKAAARRLGERYGLTWLPEDGALYQLQFSIMGDRCELFLDTTGAGLHKRGYRAVGNDAPIRETLAAAMVELARYRGRDVFVDPFCGSGTIAIEAALTARNRAPGLLRSFSCEKWAMSRAAWWQEARQEAMDLEYRGEYRILASDTDSKSLSIARENAKKARVGELIRFSQGDAREITLPAGPGLVVTNPPYGQRMLERRQAAELMRAFGRHMRTVPDYRVFIISPEEELERQYGGKSRLRRKLYNGMIQCRLYAFEPPERGGGARKI